MEKKKLFTILGIAGGLLVLMAVVAILVLTRKEFRYNDPSAVGNTAANLYNDGLFVQLEDQVYFANSYDNNALYCMTVGESEVHKVSNVIVQHLVAAGDYVYFFQNGTTGSGGFDNVKNNKGFNRYSIPEGNVENMSKDVIVYNQLVGNYLYLMSTDPKKGYRLFKLKIDRSEEVDLGNSAINPACARNGVIYYAGVDTDHALHTLDTATDTMRIALQQDLWYPTLDGEWLYYLDLNQNYRLCRYSFLTQEIQTLTTDRVDCYNVGNGYIYYQKNSSTAPALKCMRCDGTEVETVVEGNFTNINMTSYYVYFQEFGKEFATYHCAIGSANYAPFEQAQRAAMSFIE